MKNLSTILVCVVLFAAVSGCDDSGYSPIQITGIQGQVYLVATPGPTPIGWVPPPLERMSTIVVLGSDKNPVLEYKTDEKGRFAITLQAGTYYLRVKESMIPAETGPYVVKSGEMLSVRADYDSGMR